MGPNPKRNPASARTGRLCHGTAGRHLPAAPAPAASASRPRGSRSVQTDQTGGFRVGATGVLKVADCGASDAGGSAPPRRRRLPRTPSSTERAARLPPGRPGPPRAPARHRRCRVHRVLRTQPGRRGRSPPTAGRLRPALEAASRATEAAGQLGPRVHGQGRRGLATGNGCDELTPKSPGPRALCGGHSVTEQDRRPERRAPRGSPEDGQRCAGRDSSALAGLSRREQGGYRRGL